MKADYLAAQTFDLMMNYDKDGNFKSLKRYDPNNNLVDNFSYSYYSINNIASNRVSRVSGSNNQYTYDPNGNVSSDSRDVNDTKSMVYDFRNLLIQLRSIRPPSISGTGIFEVIYRYDEAGNRIRKQVWQYLGQEPSPVFEGTSPNWQLESDEFYVRDVNGKEVVIYNSSTLTQWNLWAMDQVGHMNSDTSKYFYLKDHLGSVRAIINTQNQVTSAQDYDAWGYLHDTRTYSANNKYKFTGKERDLESNYDYFGARYYDSRIGRWGGVEPLYDKYIGISPFVYSFANPIAIKDINGRDGKITIDHQNQAINIEINIAYISTQLNEKSGLDIMQQAVLNDFKTEIESYWSGQSITLNDIDYEVNTKVNLVEAENMLDLNLYSITEGNNIALNRTEEIITKSQGDYSVAGIIGNYLYLDKPEKLTLSKILVLMKWDISWVCRMKDMDFVLCAGIMIRVCSGSGQTNHILKGYLKMEK